MCGGEGLFVGGYYLVHKQSLNDPFNKLIFDCAYFVLSSFNHFERLGFFIFMYYLFGILSQQVDGPKNALSYDCPPHMTNSRWLPNQSQTSAQVKNHLQR